MSAVQDLITINRDDWTDSPYPDDVVHRSADRYTALEIHHGGVPIRLPVEDQMEAVRRYQVGTKGYQDFWYHLWIHPRGWLAEGRGALAANSSRPYLTVLIPGLDSATEEQWGMINEIRRAMAEDNASSELRYHAMRGGTVCPGSNTIARIHQMWAAEKTTGGLLVSATDIDPEFHLEGMANIARMGTVVVEILRLNGVDGYATVHLDGGVATFGDFPYLGSVREYVDLLDEDPSDHVVAAAASFNSTGQIGYSIVTARGGIFNFGATNYHGRVDIIDD